MPATAKSIDATSPRGAKLLVSRSDVKGRLTVSTTMRLNRQNTVVASVTLDTQGWHELLQCVAFPPEQAVQMPASVPSDSLYRRRYFAGGNPNK